MNDVLTQINSVPGMVGCMVCNEHGQVLDQAFPPLFDEHILEEVSAVVSENFPDTHGFTNGADMYDFRCSSGRIIVKPISEGYFVLLCASTINLHLLTISMNVAVKKLERLIKTASNAPKASVAAPAPVSAPVATGKISPDELLQNGPLAPSLQGMQSALAKILGPMAKIIFLECVEKWINSHQPSMASLPDLVDIIAGEINNSDKEVRYRQMVISYI